MDAKQKLHQVYLQKWAARFAEQKASGLTIRQWCEVNHLSFHTYGAVALANIFCWAAALLYAQMGAKSVVISPPSLINTGSFPDIPFGMPDFKLFCFQPLKSMLSLMKKDDSPFFRSESCNEAY